MWFFRAKKASASVKYRAATVRGGARGWCTAHFTVAALFVRSALRRCYFFTAGAAGGLGAAAGADPAGLAVVAVAEPGCA